MKPKRPSFTRMYKRLLEYITYLENENKKLETHNKRLLRQNIYFLDNYVPKDQQNIIDRL